MDLGDQITPTPDPEPHAAVRMLRATSGFYRSDLHLFYVTGDGRILLVGAPGEAACLRPRDVLPDEAQAVCITSAAHLLLADTAEQLASPAGPYLRADVGRDARVLAASMLQDLLASFWGMLRDLARFYREAPAFLEGDDTGPTLGEYLGRGGYGAMFRDEHLVPMASALWSSPPQGILAFPARYLVQFMVNHHMLTLGERSPWRVVAGGSATYVAALRERWRVQERVATPVHAVLRCEDKVGVVTATSTERFDHVVMACHSDDALRLLHDADARERGVLGAIRYQSQRHRAAYRPPTAGLCVTIP